MAGAEVMYNFNTGAHNAVLGYDYQFRNARVRGTINSQWVVSAYVEEKMHAGFNFVLSAEVDHKRSDWKFGMGVVLEPV